MFSSWDVSLMCSFTSVNVCFGISCSLLWHCGECRNDAHFTLLISWTFVISLDGRSALNAPAHPANEGTGSAAPAVAACVCACAGASHPFWLRSPSSCNSQGSFLGRWELRREAAWVWEQEFSWISNSCFWRSDDQKWTWWILLIRLLGTVVTDNRRQ